jgi:hypothetical protein
MCMAGNAYKCGINNKTNSLCIPQGWNEILLLQLPAYQYHLNQQHI